MQSLMVCGLDVGGDLPVIMILVWLAWICRQKPQVAVVSFHSVCPQKFKRITPVSAFRSDGTLWRGTTLLQKRFLRRCEKPELGTVGLWL